MAVGQGIIRQLFVPAKSYWEMLNKTLTAPFTKKAAMITSINDNYYVWHFNE